MKRINYINNILQDEVKLGNIKTDDISDGYHTFGELYKHRIHLFIALCKSKYIIENMSKNNAESFDTIYTRFFTIQKSKKHNDGSEFEGWFIIQLETPRGQISYHLPNKYWGKCDFIKTVDKANEWDGHTSDDVLERLLLI